MKSNESPIRHTHTPPRRGEAGFTLIELLIVLVFLAIVVGIAIQAAFFAFDVSRLGATVGNIRGVSTCLLDYENVTSGLPAGGLQTVATIEPTLRVIGVPVPTRDGWGNDLYYEPLVVDGVPSFRVFSYGKDGTPDGAVTGVWVDFFTDIVNESGTFIQSKW